MTFFELFHLVENDSTATKYNMTEAALETAVDDALKKADFNYDGMISWQEYVYSLGREKTEESSEEHAAAGAPKQNDDIENNKI